MACSNTNSKKYQKMHNILKLADPCILNKAFAISFIVFPFEQALCLDISVIFLIMHDASPFDVISECSFRNGTNNINVPRIVS